MRISSLNITIATGVATLYKKNLKLTKITDNAAFNSTVFKQDNLGSPFIVHDLNGVLLSNIHLRMTDGGESISQSLKELYGFINFIGSKNNLIVGDFNARHLQQDLLFESHGHGFDVMRPPNNDDVIVANSSIAQRISNINLNINVPIWQIGTVNAIDQNDISNPNYPLSDHLPLSFILQM
jgi:hypothetical protein